MNDVQILLVEDQRALARTYQGFLRNEPYEIAHVESGASALQALDGNPSAVILDLKLPDMSGLDILGTIRKRGLNLPVVVITAHGSMQTAIDAMRAGAADFLVKPFTAERLKVTLQNVLEKEELTATVRTYQEEIDLRNFQGFIGSSLKMQAVFRAIESAANSKATVFFTGESGTGKEIAARAVHDLSGRKGKFVPLNCGAIPRDLMESEFFGHVKGAFTGALAEREGAARQAHKGTLFLDEVCEMDLQLQTKLLRFLQTGQFNKVGGSTLEAVDVRVVCATNRDPYAEVQAGRFREDLYYRLHVIPIHMPPLRERGQDIVEIATHFFEQFSSQEGRKFDQLSEEAQAMLRKYSWPGNVRELQNVVRNVVVMNRADFVEAQVLEPLIKANGRSHSVTYESSSTFSRRTASLDQLAEQIRPLSEVERQAIEQALDLCEGDVRKAAVFLDIAPATIYRKLKAWGSD
jgi:DNA-binding NtrC family response regulator